MWNFTTVKLDLPKPSWCQKMSSSRIDTHGLCLVAIGILSAALSYSCGMMHARRRIHFCGGAMSTMCSILFSPRIVCFSASKKILCNEALGTLPTQNNCTMLMTASKFGLTMFGGTTPCVGKKKCSTFSHLA
jgi:hypothetical protein